MLVHTAEMLLGETRFVHLIGGQSGQGKVSGDKTHSAAPIQASGSAQLGYPETCRRGRSPYPGPLGFQSLLSAKCSAWAHVFSVKQ